jgi:predicted metal-dependent hydrolase
VASTAWSLLRDPSRPRLKELRKSLARARQSPFITPEVWRRLRDYNRRDFHPDDHDTTVLLEHWRAELFGPGGRITDHLERQPAGAA